MLAGQFERDAVGQAVEQLRLLISGSKVQILVHSDKFTKIIPLVFLF